jgi:hypothetical protein
MKFTLEFEHFRDSAMTAVQSRFEQPDIGSVCDAAVCARFGGRLQKIFPPPSESAAPKPVLILLQRIDEIFAGPHSVGDEVTGHE